MRFRKVCGPGDSPPEAFAETAPISKAPLWCLDLHSPMFSSPREVREPGEDGGPVAQGLSPALGGLSWEQQSGTCFSSWGFAAVSSWATGA